MPGVKPSKFPRMVKRKYQQILNQVSKVERSLKKNFKGEVWLCPIISMKLVFCKRAGFPSEF